MKLIERWKNSTLRRKILLWVNRVRLSTRFEWSGVLPQVVIYERYRPLVIGSKYLLIAVGLLIGLFTLGPVIGLAIGLLVFLLVEIIDRIIFSYMALYVHPMPEFEYDLDRLLGVGFGGASPPDRSFVIPVVSPIFDSHEFAGNVEELLLAWNYGNYDDETGNIQCKVVVLSETEYLFGCYPNPDRPTAEQFFEQAEQISKQHPRRHQIRSFILPMLGKYCQLSPDSYMPRFREHYQSGDQFILELVVQEIDGSIATARETGSFHLCNLEFKDIEEITRHDIEYDTLRLDGYM